MSSEESTTSRSSSSRLSQFGLYRTIDARTEEFLKLSKKRQIRQGCACAVISTALTVTIVVAVFLIYEYNGYSHQNPEKEFFKTSNISKHAHKETSRHEGTNIKLNKKKHTISTSTINLLNILLKALNHTHNLEGQEKNGSSPTFDKPDATSISFKRNVLSDIKNWLRIPNLRMLAENKAPSIFHYRNPITNEKFAKNTRKPSIYPWTDISKVSEEVLEKSPTTLIKTDRTGISVVTETTTTIPNHHIHCSNRNEHKSDCKCSKLSVLMCNLLSNIQEIFPEIIINNSICKFNSQVVIKKANSKIAKASNQLIHNSITPTVESSIKNTPHKNSHGTKIFQGEPVKPAVTGDLYKEHNKYLETSTQTLGASKIEKKVSSVNTTTKIYSNDQLRSFFRTTSAPEFTTTAVQPFIVEPQLVEYLKYFIKPTTAMTINKSERQHKTSEILHGTVNLDEYYTVTSNVQDYSKLLVNNINTDKSNNYNISRYQYEVSSKRLDTVGSATIKMDTNKENQEYSKTVYRKSETKNGLQNKKNKILLKSQFQSVMKTMKRSTEKPQNTTTIRTYTVAPGLIEYNISSTITTPTAANTTKYHKTKQILDTINMSNGVTRRTDTTPDGISPDAATIQKYKNKQQLVNEKTLERPISNIEMTTKKESLIATTTMKNYKVNHVSDIKQFLNGMITKPEITKPMGISSAAITIKYDTTHTASDKTIRRTEITAQEETPKDAIVFKYYETDQIDTSLHGSIQIREKTTQKEAISATNKMNHDQIKKHLDIEKAFDERIRSIEKITHKSTMTDTPSKDYGEIKVILPSEDVLDVPITNTEIITQKSTSVADTVPSYDKIEPNFESEKPDDKQRSITKTAQTKTVAKYFKDDFHEVNKPFKDIKFARFDSFAANSNKHIILPSYKDLNFELFPVFKRHNINAQKFGIKSEFLENNDPRMGNVFAEIMSSNRNDDYLSASNEMINTIPRRNHSKIINKQQIMSSSVPIGETSPVNWIFQTNMKNDKIKETLEEQIQNMGQESTKNINNNISEILSTTDKHGLWTYDIENDFVETTTSKLILEDEMDRYETTNAFKAKITLPHLKTTETYTNESTVSIGQLYDANKSLLQYLNTPIQSKANETDKKQLNVISYSEDSKFFEDRIQEKLKYLRDTKTNNNNNEGITMKYVISGELTVDDTEYNPSSMIPKSRPSYLEINRNFLNTGEDEDYQVYRMNYKQKRQSNDYDIFNK